MNKVVLETWEFKSPGYDEAHARYQERERIRNRKILSVLIPANIAAIAHLIFLIKR
jgi:hypothetical protein